MATEEIASYEQIALLLSELMNNYTVIMNSYYNMFYNPDPMEIILTLYDSKGNLKDYKVPNRAMDYRYIKNGKGSPENVEIAPVGTIYQDTSNGILYIKEVGTGRTGWNKVGGDVYIEGGSGSPEGVLSRARGSMYVDKSSANLYIKSTNFGKTGWELISSRPTNIDYSGV